MRFLIVLRGGAIAAILASLLIPQIHAQTQAAMNSQARGEFEQADAELNKTYQAVLKKLPDVESKQKLKETQRAWIASRDAEATRAADQARGGSMAPTIRYETMTELTQERVKQLKIRLAGDAAPDQKDASTPTPSASPDSNIEAKESPSAEENRTALSPDKQWEYKGGEIVKAGATQVVLDLDQELEVYGPESEILWSPDSKRFGFNYSPLHAHHTTYKKVAFYQLRGDKWVALHQPSDALQPSQLLQPPLKEHLPKGFNPRHCAPEWDELKLRTWSDANTAILYAPCYHHSSDLKTAFLFTLKFDDAGNWKIIKTHQMSKKELEGEQ